MFVSSFEFFISDFNKFKNDVTRCADHSLITHIFISELWVACSSWFYLQFKLLNSGNNFLRFTYMAFSTNYFAFTLTSWTCLSKEIIVASTKINSFLCSSFSSTFFASNYIIWILGSSSMTMRTCDLLFNHNIKFLTKIKILQF